MNVPTFSIWDESIHFSNDQQKRLASAQKAETTPSTVDKEAKSAEFAGSGKNPYHTTLENCTCGDFARRRLPCKHIYRLAMECGIIDADFQSGVNKNLAISTDFSLEKAIDELEKINEDAQIEVKKLLYDILYKSRDKHSFRGVEYNDALKNCKLLVETDTPITEYLGKMKKDEISILLGKIGLDVAKKKKVELVAICEAHYAEVCSLFEPIHTFSLSERAGRVARRVYSYLLRKYENDSYYDENMVRHEYPHGASTGDLVISISKNGISRNGYNPNMFFFPDDEITRLLTKYGCNRCLNGYDASK